MTLPLLYLTTDHGSVNSVRLLTTTTRLGHTVLRHCLLWPSLPGQTVQLISFYFTQLFLKGFNLHHCTEAGFWQQIGRSVWGWLRGSPTGVPWLDQTLRGHSSTPGSFEKAEGWKIPSEARWSGTLVKKAELVIPAYVSLNVSAPKNYLEEGERIGDMETPWPASGSTSYNMQCQFNKDIKLQLTTENITHPEMDTAIRTLRLGTSKRGRPNTPRRPSSAGSSQKDLDAPIPKELGLPSLEGVMLGS